MAEEIALPEGLLDILACPACEDRPNVELRDGAIHCPKCGRAYPIENGVPNMLVEDDDKGDKAGEDTADPRS